MTNIDTSTDTNIIESKKGDDIQMADNLNSGEEGGLFKNWVDRQEFAQRNSEEKVLELLIERGGSGGWAIESHPGREHGPDLKLQKGNRVILIEAKGERPSQTRHGAVTGALEQIIMNMTIQSANVAYCVAFPSTEAFTRLVCSIPTSPRQRLSLHALLVEEGTGLLKVLFPHTSCPSKIDNLDDLFTCT